MFLADPKVDGDSKKITNVFEPNRKIMSGLRSVARAGLKTGLAISKYERILLFASHILLMRIRTYLDIFGVFFKSRN